MRWLTTITGALATIGAVVVLSAVPPADSTPSTVESGPIVRTVVPVVDTATSTTGPMEVVITGLTSDVTDALAKAGYTEFVPESAVIRELPPSVAKALIDAGAVLVMPEDGGGS